MYCDSDQVAQAYVVSNWYKNTTEGCRTARSTLATWLFTTGQTTGWFAWGMTAVLYAPIWGQCVVIEAEEKAGRPLTPQEKAAALDANPPPYWIHG